VVRDRINNLRVRDGIGHFIPNYVYDHVAHAEFLLLHETRSQLRVATQWLSDKITEKNNKEKSHMEKLGIQSGFQPQRHQVHI